MVIVKCETYVYLLLEVLSVVGELPTSALCLLGNERSVKAMVHRCEQQQVIRFGEEGYKASLTLFNISGKGKGKTLRLSKDACSLLERIHPMALSGYLQAFPDAHLTGSASTIDRNHRIGESLLMCIRAGAEFRPYAMPALKLGHGECLEMEPPLCYLSKSVKAFEDSDMAKLAFCRTTGLLLSDCQPYALYNARRSVMKWFGAGEVKVRERLQTLVVHNSPHKALNSAILFANDCAVALNTVLETMRVKKRKSRNDVPFPQVYRYIHAVPLSEDGIRLLKLLIQPDIKERILEALLPEDIRIRDGDIADYECDAFRDGQYILSHLDGDIARLIRFQRTAARLNRSEACLVVCYPWQTSYVQPFFKDTASIQCIEPDALEEALE